MTKWSDKRKKAINCDAPKGFSEKAHCAGKKKMAGGGLAKPQQSLKAVSYTHLTLPTIYSV